jgi:serine/threonine-protein kinase RsbW
MRSEKKIENDSHLLKEVSKELITELKNRGVDENTVFDIHVGFEEALRNAMVHGNKSCPEKKVKVVTEISDKKVIMSVEDEGEGFEPGDVPDPTDMENILKEGGRGVYLIRHLMDEVTFENGGRKIIMTKRVN